MWIADIYCDLDWVRDRQGVLGARRLALTGPRSQSLDISIDFHLFGDDERVRHLRVLMHTDDESKAHTCVDVNIQAWVAALEVTMMMITGHPFEVVHLPGTLSFPVALSVGDENSPAVIITPQLVYAPPINYMDVAFGIASWTIDVQHHLFYFRRLIDASLPLDVRWLNGYRLLEWHFVGGRTHLPKSREWHEFVGRFGDSLAPHLRPRQTAVGLLEEARATAAHAGIDERPLEDRRRDPRNSMEKTFRVLERMVMTALNEHASRKGSPIRFQPRVPEQETGASPS